MEKSNVLCLVFFTFLFAIIFLSIYIYFGLSNIFHQAKMSTINPDSFFSQWIFLAILLYSNIRFIQRKDAYFYFQLGNNWAYY